MTKGDVFRKLAIAVLMACGLSKSGDAASSLSPEAFEALYRQPSPKLDRPIRIYHLGHSLVGRDMPAMLAQLSGPGHRYEGQLGWGTTLKEHWQLDGGIRGAEENIGFPHRNPHEAMTSGDYDAVVYTEMVEIRDAIRYHESARYLGQWARAAKAGRPTTRLFLYETWHRLDDPQGWLVRLDSDLSRYWEGEILRRAIAAPQQEDAIFVIPAGQVFARVAREMEAGRIPGLQNRRQLFSDDIHVNDLGAYIVALTHYAVLYRQSPVGLPHRLRRHDDTAAKPLPDEAVAHIQRLVWEVVTALRHTGTG